MTKEFIDYEQALELKELGFDEECIASYTQTLRFDVLEQNGIMWHTVTNEKLKEYEKACTVPLYQQAFRFFRDKYGVKVISIGGDNERLYSYIIHPENNEQIFGKKEDTYDKAELACLKKLIEILKNK